MELLHCCQMLLPHLAELVDTFTDSLGETRTLSPRSLADLLGSHLHAFARVGVRNVNTVEEVFDRFVILGRLLFELSLSQDALRFWEGAYVWATERNYEPLFAQRTVLETVSSAPPPPPPPTSFSTSSSSSSSPSTVTTSSSSVPRPTEKNSEPTSSSSNTASTTGARSRNNILLPPHPLTAAMCVRVRQLCALCVNLLADEEVTQRTLWNSRLDGSNLGQ